MADKPIGVGDLVMVVGCLNKKMKHHIGKIGRVYAPSSIHKNHWVVEGVDLDINGLSCSWCYEHLKRLDPDALKDDVPTKEELTA